MSHIPSPSQIPPSLSSSPYFPSRVHTVWQERQCKVSITQLSIHLSQPVTPPGFLPRSSFLPHVFLRSSATKPQCFKQWLYLSLNLGRTTHHTHHHNPFKCINYKHSCIFSQLDSVSFFHNRIPFSISFLLHLTSSLNLPLFLDLAHYKHYQFSTIYNQDKMRTCK